jgi:hypothetical protein
VERLVKYSPANTEHIFYIVDDKNPKLNDFARNELENIGEVFYRKDNPILKSRHRTLPPLGGDKNYDWLISKVKTEYFLTLHDDTILFSRRPFDWIKSGIADGKEFGGFTDGRVHSTYNTLYYKSVPFSEIRIGTWFLYGNTNEFVSKNMSMGFYKNVWKPFTRLSLKSSNVRTTRIRQWVNGGFPFNIMIRDYNYQLNIEEYDDQFKFSDDIIHKEKVTGFFVSRNLIDFIDTDDEIEKWKEYWNSCETARKTFEIKFLDELNNFISANGQNDKSLKEILTIGRAEN